MAAATAERNRPRPCTASTRPSSSRSFRASRTVDRRGREGSDSRASVGSRSPGTALVGDHERGLSAQYGVCARPPFSACEEDVTAPPARRPWYARTSSHPVALTGGTCHMVARRAADSGAGGQGFGNGRAVEACIDEAGDETVAGARRVDDLERQCAACCHQAVPSKAIDPREPTVTTERAAPPRWMPQGELFARAVFSPPSRRRRESAANPEETEQSWLIVRPGWRSLSGAPGRPPGSIPRCTQRTMEIASIASASGWYSAVTPKSSLSNTRSPVPVRLMSSGAVRHQPDEAGRGRGTRRRSASSMIVRRPRPSDGAEVRDREPRRRSCTATLTALPPT